MRDEHRLHLGCKFKLFLHCLLAKALPEESLIFNGDHYYAGNSLDEIQMLQHWTHSFSFLINITNEYIRKGNHIVEYRDDYINAFIARKLCYNCNLGEM